MTSSSNQGGAAPLVAGEVFAGYTIIRPLGVGGMGEVYLAQHPRLPRQDALKVLRSEISGDPTFRARFIREADSIAVLDHPNIVKVYDRGETGDLLWIATQYIDGTDAAALRRRFPAGMPADEAIALIGAVADALDFAHGRNLIHRDVKPANILLDQPDAAGDRRAYLADFGIARNLSEPGGLTATSITPATVEYAAPEQLLGEPIDGRADQYALAATAYHLLTGTPVFPTTNPIAAMNAHINTTPPDLARTRPDLAALAPVLATALAKDPAHRYRSCREFARALKAAATHTTGGAIPAPPGGPQPTMVAPPPPTPASSPTTPPAAKPAGSKLVWVALAAAALALVAVALGLTGRQSSPNPAPTALAPISVAAPATVTQTAVATITATVPPAPPAAVTPAAASIGVVVGTCGGVPEAGFKGGVCGIAQRSGPYTEASRLTPEALPDGTRVTIACKTDGDLRESDSTASRTWYRLTTGAYLPAVYVSTTSAIPVC